MRTFSPLFTWNVAIAAVYKTAATTVISISNNFDASISMTLTSWRIRRVPDGFIPTCCVVVLLSQSRVSMEAGNSSSRVLACPLIRCAKSNESPDHFEFVIWQNRFHRIYSAESWFIFLWSWGITLITKISVFNTPTKSNMAFSSLKMTTLSKWASKLA